MRAHSSGVFCTRSEQCLHRWRVALTIPADGVLQGYPATANNPGPGAVPLAAVVPRKPVERPLAQRGPVRSRALDEQRLAGGAGRMLLQQRLHVLRSARPVQRAHRPGHTAGRAATWRQQISYIAVRKTAGEGCACHERGGTGTNAV